MLVRAFSRPLLPLTAASALLLIAACAGTEEIAQTGTPTASASPPAIATAIAPTHPAAATCDGLIERIQKAGASRKIEGIPYAFLTTAGAVVEWDESPQPSHSGYAVPGTSRFRAYPADTPAVFCYLDYAPREVAGQKPQMGDPPLSPTGGGGRELFIMVQGASYPVPVQSGTWQQVQPDPPAGAISLIP